MKIAIIEALVIVLLLWVIFSRSEVDTGIYERRIDSLRVANNELRVKFNEQELLINIRQDSLIKRKPIYDTIKIEYEKQYDFIRNTPDSTYARYIRERTVPKDFFH